MAFVEGKTPYGRHAFDPYIEMLHRWVNAYLYPPPSLLAFWPLVHWSLPAAFLLFTIFSHLCLLGSAWLMLTKLTPLPEDKERRQIQLCLSLAYILSFHAVAGTIGVGQVNLIVLFFVCLALVPLKSDSSSWRIALPLSIAILLKTYPVFLLALLFFRRRFKAVALTCAFYAVFTVASALVLPQQVWSSWAESILPAAVLTHDEIPTAYVWNQSIGGFVARLLREDRLTHAPLHYPDLAKPVTNILELVVIAVTFFFSYRASRRSDRISAIDDQIAAFLLMIYLVAPLSWTHHLVYILPALLVALGMVLNESPGRKQVAIVALALIMLAKRFPLDNTTLAKHWWVLLASLPFYAVAALWLVFVYRLSNVRPALDQVKNPLACP